MNHFPLRVSAPTMHIVRTGRPAVVFIAGNFLEFMPRSRPSPKALGTLASSPKPHAYLTNLPLASDSDFPAGALFRHVFSPRPHRRVDFAPRSAQKFPAVGLSDFRFHPPLQFCVATTDGAPSKKAGGRSTPLLCFVVSN